MKFHLRLCRKRTHIQYVNFNDCLEVTGVQDDADICEEVLQNKQVEKDDVNEETTATARLHQKIKKCNMT